MSDWKNHVYRSLLINNCHQFFNSLNFWMRDMHKKITLIHTQRDLLIKTDTGMFLILCNHFIKKKKIS